MLYNRRAAQVESVALLSSNTKTTVDACGAAVECSRMITAVPHTSDLANIITVLQTQWMGQCLGVPEAVRTQTIR